MAQAIPTITLNTVRDIPFNKLVLSQQNVRKIKAGISIEDLAEDIAHRGLLSSLNVRPEFDSHGSETGIYRIPAGGRRYRALELLVSQNRLERTSAVPCIVGRGETPEVEDSLAENVQRVDLHPLDQFRAFQSLREQGLHEEDIAARFFVSIAAVRQRLRLASVSPRLLDLYAADEMTLQQVMAFSITNDHLRQEQVWDTVWRSQVQEPYYIRRLLTETAIRANDRRAVYVGVEAYEAAGGLVMRDLFEQDQGGWLKDPTLLEQLAIEKLAFDAEALKAAEGWKWVEAAFDFPYGHTCGLRRLHGARAEMSKEELDRSDALRTEYDRLDAEYTEAGDYCGETERRLEELGTEVDRLNDRPYIFDPDEIACGGAFISIAANGTLKVERGFVRATDEPTAGAMETAIVSCGIDGDNVIPASYSSGGVSLNGHMVSTELIEESDDVIRPLPDRLVADLTATHTMALRNALSKDPATAFIAVLHAFVLKTFFVYGSDSCLELTLQSAKFMQTRGLAYTVWAKEIDQRHEAWAQDLPKTPDGLWAFLTKLDEGRRQSLFAHCVSLTLNAVIEPWSKGTGAIAHAKQIARSIGFDMVDAGWKPTVDSYLGRVTKAHILQAVREAKGEQSAQLIQRLKKADMACEAERLLDGSGWLPEVLRLAGSEAATAKSQAVIDHADHENDDMITNSVLSEWAAFLPDAEINDRADDLGDVCHQDYLDAAG